MTRESFQTWLAMLAKNYGLEPDRERIKFISQAIAQAVGFSHDWNKIFCDIAAKEKFYPNTAVIVEYVNKLSPTTRQLSTQEIASRFIDQMILGFTGPQQDYAGLGRDGYHFAKNVLGLTRSSFNTGGINPQMMRKQWVEIALRYLESNPDEIHKINLVKLEYKESLPQLPVVTPDKQQATKMLETVGVQLKSLHSKINHSPERELELKKINEDFVKQHLKQP